MKESPGNLLKPNTRKLLTFIERYPNSSEADIAQFPRASSTNLLTKEKIAAKIKRIRNNYKKAVDASPCGGEG